MTLIEESDAPDAGEPALLALERRFAELVRDVETLEVAARDERLRRTEVELCDFQCQLAGESGAREHPVLGVSLGWEERLRRGDDRSGAEQMDALASEILIRGLRSRERTAVGVLELPDDAPISAERRDRIFEGLVAVEELRYRVEGRAATLGTSTEADARAVCEEADGVQRVLRDALDRSIAKAPPDALTRRQWTGELIDLADETLLGAGEKAARLSQRQLGEASRALRWHMEHVEPEAGDERRRLRRRERRLNSERVEQLLLSRLEARFGSRRVELWERGIFVALLGVVALLFIDVAYGASAWTLWLDTGLCAFLLIDFLVKASMVGFHRSWLKRHVLTDFLPALPFAWIASLDVLAADTGRAGRLLRLVRVVRIAQYLRVALPIIRLFRALSFLVRGLDRLVRRNSRLLEKEVLLFPSPEDRRRSREHRDSDEERLWRLRSDLDGLFERLLEEGDEQERRHIAEVRLAALREAATTTVEVHDRAGHATRRRQSVPLADRWLHHLSSIRSEEVEGRVGGEAIRRIARGARLVARSPLRWVFLLGRWAPADAADLPDRRVASRTVRGVARSLATLHRRVLWWADLRGTLTPGELVGRVGSTLVARTSRPAVRLLLFGGLYLLLQLLLQLLQIDIRRVAEAGLELAEQTDQAPNLLLRVYSWLDALVSTALAVVGGVCLAILALGVWMQRLARDATIFHEQVARAQFLHLTDSIKARQREHDAALLSERVFQLERNLFERDGAFEATRRDEARFVRHLERFLAEGISPPSRDEGFDPVARGVMLYRDLLDGALLARSDTRATSQLLGNLSVQRMLQQSRRAGKSVQRALLRIDLERRRSFLKGPYLWFQSISHALSTRAARLIVDYNAHAVPLSELPRVTSEERTRYERWLARARRGDAAQHPGSSSDPEHGEGEAAVGESDSEASAPGVEVPQISAPQITTAFTVLHFLDDAPARDAEVAQRFGPRVLERMQRDRRALVRTVFGTFPLHRLPRESRVLNLRVLYSEWVEGGRVLLIPLRLGALAARLTVQAARSLVQAVAAIRRPELALQSGADAEADFTAAARKIGRMRGPGALAALHLRALFDPEYHGIALPFGLHDADEASESARAPAIRDAEFLGAEPALMDLVAALGARAQRNVGRLEAAADGGMLERISDELGVDVTSDPQTLRALVTLVHADDDGLRSDLFGLQILAEATVDALEFGLPQVGTVVPLPLWLSFQAWWSREGGRDRLFEAVRASGVVAFDPDEESALTESGRRAYARALERRIRRAAWRSVWADVDGARSCLASVRERIQRGDAPSDARARAEARLVDALRHPARVTEQLVTLRTIQTLSLVDVRNYRRHVWSIGQYESEGDLGGVLLDVARD